MVTDDNGNNPLDIGGHGWSIFVSFKGMGLVDTPMSTVTCLSLLQTIAVGLCLMSVAMLCLGPAPFFLDFDWTRQLSWCMQIMGFVLFGVGFALVVVSSRCIRQYVIRPQSVMGITDREGGVSLLLLLLSGDGGAYDGLLPCARWSGVREG